SNALQFSSGGVSFSAYRQIADDVDVRGDSFLVLSLTLERATDAECDVTANGQPTLIGQHKRSLVAACFQERVGVDELDVACDQPQACCWDKSPLDATNAWRSGLFALRFLRGFF